MDHHNKNLKVSSGIRAGDGFDPSICWADRNARSVKCALSGWPQDDRDCAGQNNEILLRRCLAYSFTPNWWKSVQGCENKTKDDCLYELTWTDV